LSGVANSEVLALAFRLGEPVSHARLTVVPLFATEEPGFEFVSLEEALAAGLSVEEVDEAGVVESIRVTNPLASAVLLYEGEAIAGAKQDRIFDRPVLVPERASVDVPVLCVERGRWSYRSRRFRSSPHAAYPKLRRLGHTSGQAGVWRDVQVKSARLGAVSDTDAVEAVYARSRRELDGYLAALPCQAGQCGSVVGIAGKFVCLDFIARPEVHAHAYAKLLRGYALDAIEAQAGEALPDEAAEQALAEVVAAERERVPAGGRDELHRLRSNRVIGWELRHGLELIALTVLAA
jgi:hypothetical protein